MPVAWSDGVAMFSWQTPSRAAIRFGPFERARSQSVTRLESESDSKRFQNRGPPGHQPAVLGPSSAIAARHLPWTGPASEGPDLSARIAVQGSSLYDERYHRLNTQDSELAAWCNFWN